MMRHSSMRN
uniref:Uncharacterized protein n=1 Tax=Rhizophora mucronata TaxID=61149 RepID=A0A2P2IX33_RHIMU